MKDLKAVCVGGEARLEHRAIGALPGPDMFRCQTTRVIAIQINISQGQTSRMRDPGTRGFPFSEKKQERSRNKAFQFW